MWGEKHCGASKASLPRGRQKWEENHWEHFSRSRRFWEQTSPKWVLAARQAGDPFFPEVGSRVEAQGGGSDLLWEY